MSDAPWFAALVDGGTAQIWRMDGATPDGEPHTCSVDALASLPATVVAAGLPNSGMNVPAKPELKTRHVKGLPNVVAIEPLCQQAPAGRTNGAETAIAGYLSLNRTFDGVLLVLSSETCWAHISAEEIVSFQTCLTPWLANALSNRFPEPDAAFLDAMNETLSRPERLAQHLSSAKAKQQTSVSVAHLIGAEIAATKAYWLGQRVVVLGDAPNRLLYRAALEHQGALVEDQALEPFLIKGLHMVWLNLRDGITAQKN